MIIYTGNQSRPNKAAIILGVGVLLGGTVGVVYYVVKKKGSVKVTQNYTQVQEDVKTVQEKVDTIDQNQQTIVDKGQKAIIAISKGELDKATSYVFDMTIKAYDSQIGLCDAQIKLLYTEVHAAEQSLSYARTNKRIVRTRHGNRIMVDEDAVKSAELNLGNTKIKVDKAVKEQQDKKSKLQAEKEQFVTWFKANKPELEQRYIEYRVKGKDETYAIEHLLKSIPTKI